MKKETSIKVLLAITASLIAFHTSVLLKILPYDIVWGGKVKSDSEMYTLESVSLMITIVLLLTILIKSNYLKAFLPEKIVNVILWVFVLLFVFNTITNLLAENYIEKALAIVTAISAGLIWSILRNDQQKMT